MGSLTGQDQLKEANFKMSTNLVACATAVIASLLSNTHGLKFPLTMPYVHPRLPNKESYLCTGVAVDPEIPLHITGFTPTASKDTVHHLMVIGCEYPVSSVDMNLWNCGGTLSEAGLPNPGGTCPGSMATQILFMWSLDADGLDFPPDVSLTVGGNSSIQHLVLQVHYVSNNFIPYEGDTSGVIVDYQAAPTDFSAGIVSLHVHGKIPAGSLAYWDSACRLLGSTPIQPWAFLGHTHHLGQLVTGWQVSENMTWTGLGISNPQQPQRFNPIANEMILVPGDILAARCVMKSDDTENDVSQGLSSKMEMCDFFVYFWTRKEDFVNGPSGQQCTNKGPPEVSWGTMGLSNIPSESYLLKHFEK